jgi:hypothetical protein
VCLWSFFIVSLSFHKVPFKVCVEDILSKNQDNKVSLSDHDNSYLMSEQSRRRKWKTRCPIPLGSGIHIYIATIGHLGHGPHGLNT